MKFKRPLLFILSLLIVFNTTTNASFYSGENTTRNSIVLTGAAIMILLLSSSKVRTWIKSFLPYFNIYGNRILYQDNGIVIYDNKIAINTKDYSQERLDKLPTIQPSGKLETIAIPSSITTICMNGAIAKICIKNGETPRIELDQAFSDIVFNIDANGTLTVTTRDNKPRKYTYNGKPLCTLYAQLSTTVLNALCSSMVFIDEQKLKDIVCSNSSTITGSIIPAEKTLNIRANDAAKINLKTIISKKKQTKSVNLFAKDSAKITLNCIQCEQLNITVSDSSTIYTSGTAINQTLQVSDSSTYHGQQLINQNGNIEAIIYDSSTAYIAGTATNQTLQVSDSSTYNGQLLIATNTSFTISDSSKALLQVKEKLYGHASDSSSVRYQGKPSLYAITCKSSSQCSRY